MYFTESQNGFLGHVFTVICCFMAFNFVVLPALVLRSHVWGHFCLSYDGQKLIKDKVSLQSFGIKDGDQVCVVFFGFFGCM